MGVQEISGINNISYLLADNSLYYMVIYKVLKGQDKDYFLKSTKLFFNGHIKLMYFTSGYKSLAKMIPYINADELFTILMNLLNAVLDIRENGFLPCSNLEINSPEQIFIDQKTLEVKLIYLPLTSDNDFTAFEYMLRRNLLQIIRSVPAFNTDKMKSVYNELSDPEQKLEVCYTKLLQIAAGDKKTSGSPYRVIPPTNGQPVLKVSSLDNETVFFINKKEYVLGRGGDVEVDGRISSAYVGRAHCKFIFEDHEYGLVDLESRNGTYLNGGKLYPGKLYRVLDGDIIRLADSSFRIQLQGI